MGFKIENGVLTKYIEEPGVTEVVIPDDVTSIGGGAFRLCSSLTSVTIGNGLRSVDNIPIDCLKKIVVSPDNMNLMSKDNVVYDKTGTILLRCAGKKTGEFTIPDNVTIIRDGAFMFCKKLNTVTIPDSVTIIGNTVFSSCDSLTSVIIPDSVTSIGDWAFRSCTSLTSITIPDSVTNIGYCAFQGCKKIKKLQICGYTIDGKKIDFDKFDKVDRSDITTMLDKKDYSMKMSHPIKFQFVTQVYLRDGQPEAEVYIKKNISKILPFFIDINDYETVKVLLESGKFVTKRNIMKFVDYAIENTQKGGDMQIQVLIMNYRNEHFPDIDPLKSFKL